MTHFSQTFTIARHPEQFGAQSFARGPFDTLVTECNKATLLTFSGLSRHSPHRNRNRAICSFISLFFYLKKDISVLMDYNIWPKVCGHANIKYVWQAKILVNNIFFQNKWWKRWWNRHHMLYTHTYILLYIYLLLFFVHNKKAAVYRASDTRIVLTSEPCRAETSLSVKS